MKKVKICLSGLGNVGRHFIRLLIERREMLQGKYGLDIELIAVSCSDGGLVSSSPLELDTVCDYSRQQPWASSFPGIGQDGLEGWRIIENSQADILVEATPTDLQTGEPGLTNFKTAIANGMDVVTLTKGALVKDFSGLMELSKSRGLVIKFSGATAAALPTIDMAEYCLAGATINSIKGILNGTTNFILTKMSQEKVDYDTALKEAQDLGIAEPKPDLDVQGWDTAAKIVILSNAIYGTTLSMKDIPVSGIDRIDPEVLEKASSEGKVVKLVGESSIIAESGGKHDQGKVNVSVAPVPIEAEHVLASVDGTTKAIHFETDTLGELTVIGGKSNPRAAAAAALKDLVNLAREGR